MIRGRLRKGHGEGEPEDQGPQQGEGDDYVEIDPAQLTNVFAVPQWFRDVGLTAWLFVGVGIFLFGVIWLLSLTDVIVMPLIAAGVVATVASPLIAWLNRHRIPRGIAAALVMVGIGAVGVGVVLMVVGGVTAQDATAGSHLSSAQDAISGWLEDLGVDPGKAEEVGSRPPRRPATVSRRSWRASSPASASSRRWSSSSR